MSYTASALRGTRRQLVLQLILVVLIAAPLVPFNAGLALAAVFGGVISITNSVLELWSLQRTAGAACDPVASIGLLYRYALQRFLLTLCLFGIGLGLLKLEPLPVMAGFFVAQIALIFRWLSEMKLRRKDV